MDWTISNLESDWWSHIELHSNAPPTGGCQTTFGLSASVVCYGTGFRRVKNCGECRKVEVVEHVQSWVRRLFADTHFILSVILLRPALVANTQRCWQRLIISHCICVVFIRLYWLLPFTCHILIRTLYNHNSICHTNLLLPVCCEKFETQQKQI